MKAYNFIMMHNDDDNDNDDDDDNEVRVHFARWLAIGYLKSNELSF